MTANSCSNAERLKTSEYQPAPSPSKAANQSGLTTPIDEHSPEWMKRAWDRFMERGDYRVAAESDFAIPEGAGKNNYEEADIRRAEKYPYVIADINNDTYSHDLAVIVVDTKKNGPERFGVIIFNEPTGSGGGNDTSPSWLYSDRDLSKTLLSQWSGGLMLRTYHDDGTLDQCFVNWNHRTNSYSCDSKYAAR